MGTTEDDIPTRRIRKIDWLPPVRRVEDLPVHGVPEGTMCFVEGAHARADEEVWEFRSGAWRRVDTL